MVMPRELTAVAAPVGAAAAPAMAQDGIDPKEAVDIATDAYVYGYSLVTTDVTRLQMSNVDKVTELNAPLNQFFNVKRYPPGDYRGVSAPNADTLYSVTWVDLSEPQVFSHPDMGKRYFLFPMVDLWMSIVQSPGARTTGGKAGNFLLTGPGWKGEVPKGMTHYQFGTRYMLILGRTYASGTEADYKTVHALQARAVVAAFGWPANLQEDAVYPYTLIDSKGEKLTGANEYTMTFAKGQMPPVNGFWSITMYLIDQGWWFVPNKLNKFTVSPRDHLKPNADGSTTLYFQKDPPGKDKESNWLPAPEGEFIPMMRMYWAKEKAPSILDLSWKPPQIQKVN